MKTIDINNVDWGTVVPVATKDRNGLMGKELFRTTLMQATTNVYSKYLKIFEGEGKDWKIFSFILTINGEALPPNMFIFNGTSSSESNKGSATCKRICGEEEYHFYFKKDENKVMRIYTSQFKSNSTRIVSILPLGGVVGGIESLDALDTSTLTEITVS